MRVKWREYNTVEVPEVYHPSYKGGGVDEIWYEGEVVGNGGTTSNAHFIVLLDSGRFRLCPLSQGPELIKSIDGKV